MRFIQKIFTVIILFSILSCDSSVEEKDSQNSLNENNVNEEIPENNNIQLNVKKETKILFDLYAPKIEKTKGVIIANSEVYTGDLNNDGKEDAIMWFYLTPAEGGNLFMGNEIAVYINEGNKMKAVAGFEPDYRFSVKEIEKGKIHIIKYEFAENDSPNNPSIQKHIYLILNGNKLTESRTY